MKQGEGSQLTVSLFKGDKSHSQESQDSQESQESLVPSVSITIAAIAALSAMGVANNWVFYLPAACFPYMQEHFAANGGYDHDMNLALFSIYSWPNVVLPLFGGLISDTYIGYSWGMMICMALVLLGQSGFCIGVFLGVGGWYGGGFVTIFVSRLVFGVGGETLMALQNTAVMAWSVGSSRSSSATQTPAHADESESPAPAAPAAASIVWPSLGLAIMESVFRISTVLTFAVAPLSVKAIGLEYTGVVGVVICVFCLMFGLCFVLLDTKYQKQQPAVDHHSAQSLATSDTNKANQQTESAPRHTTSSPRTTRREITLPASPSSPSSPSSSIITITNTNTNTNTNTGKSSRS